jgi:hypothetical protein
MRHLFISTLAVATLAFGASAMAQTTPVPGGSGSQVTNPQTYRDTAKKDRESSMMLQQRQMGMTTGSVHKHHAVKKHHPATHHNM